MAINELSLFVTGVPRSGTTLLRLLLSAHPAICIAPEKSFFGWLEKRFGNANNLSAQRDEFIEELYKHPNTKFVTWGIEKKTIAARLKQEPALTYLQAITILYQMYALKTYPEAYLLGNKDPSYLYHIETLLKYCPQAKIIHIIRDIRAVYSSTQKKALLKEKIVNQQPILHVTKHWRQAERVMEKYKNDKRFYTLHYEKLVSSPEEQLKKLFAWLGVEYCDSVLKFYEENASKKLVPENKYAWHYRTLQPITDKQIDAWKTELKQSEIELLELMNRRRMQKWGYVRATSFPYWSGVFKLLSYFSSLVFTKLFKKHSKILLVLNFFLLIFF